MLIVNEDSIIDPISEMHYKFHHKVEDPSSFPQKHNFFEIQLITNGSMIVIINGKRETLSTGSLIMIRPGDIHEKRASNKNCSYINLAFHTRVIEELFHYLCMNDAISTIMAMPCPPQSYIHSGDLMLLKAQMERLNFCPVTTPEILRSELRGQVYTIMTKYFVPIFSSQKIENYPGWLNDLINFLNIPEHYTMDLSEMAEESGYSREYICRAFRKYIGMSPITYLNAKRLNYAANLLIYSDQKVIDIAYASGFQSLSRFYHAFRKEYQVSALEYRRIHMVQKID